MTTRADVAVIGAGPAGLSAAVYTARAGLSTLVLGCDPKVAGDYDIDNYFGFAESIKGKDLIERGRAQALRFGATLVCERVLAAHHAESGFHLKTEAGDYEAKALIVAAGVARIRPGVENLADYEGKGVSYCVSCDGFFYKGKSVVVVGEGIFAANQALELTNYTPTVRIVTQGKAPGFGPEFASKLAEAGVPVLEGKVVRLAGTPGMDTAILADGTEIAAEGLFVAIGEASSLDFAYTLGLERNGNFLVVDGMQHTNIPGVFAAGDCVGGFLQIAVAVGEGAKAGKAAIDHVKALAKKSA